MTGESVTYAVLVDERLFGLGARAELAALDPELGECHRDEVDHAGSLVLEGRAGELVRCARAFSRMPCDSSASAGESRLVSMSLSVLSKTSCQAL